MLLGKSLTILWHLGHLVAYFPKRPQAVLEKAMLITSIDIDVGSRKLGILNNGENDRNISPLMSEYEIGKIEETCIPILAGKLDEFEVPATFAIRGQVTEVDDTFLSVLLRSKVEHDIGAHGYYHRNFTDLSRGEAEKELEMISNGMKKFGILPKSFVFPKNRIAHLNLLPKYGYKCYRGYGTLLHDYMNIEKQGRLYNVHPSLYINEGTSHFLVEKILNIAIRKKLPFHMWFHLWNFGKEKESIIKNVDKILVPILAYAKKKEKKGLLTTETMLSASEEFEKSLSLEDASKNIDNRQGEHYN